MATTYAIPDGRVAMVATLWTGDATTNRTINNSVNGVSFQPDLVWTKGRNATWQNFLQDSVRGVANFLISDTAGAETTTSPNIVSSFASNGFVIQNNGNSNNTGSTYVGWQWKAGGTAVSNTAGSIASQVSANVAAGFSIVTYTGTGANATVGHGLGVAPKLVIVKRRGAVGNWRVQHASLGYQYYGNLNDTGVFSIDATVWNSAPTSTAFGLGTNDTNTNTSTYVAYCFAEVEGYSKIGSYTGNGSSDGSFIYTGMRPRFLMVKRTDLPVSWIVIDTSRNPNNVSNFSLLPNGANAEITSSTETDILSNGFKIRTTDVSLNASGGTYIFIAFAENPFKYANAR